MLALRARARVPLPAACAGRCAPASGTGSSPAAGSASSRPARRRDAGRWRLAARRNADRIDAIMRIKAAVLDGDERLRQIGRQILQRRHWRRPFRRAVPARRRRGRQSGSSAGAWEFPATGSPADARRPRSRRRRTRNRRPQAEPPRPSRTGARCGIRRAISTGVWLPPSIARGLRSRGGGHRQRRPPACAWLMISSAGRRRRDAILRAEAQLGKLRRQARIAAPCGRRSFSVPTPYANAAQPGPPHASGAQFKGRLPRG